jgi:ParB-like chromosome segregation protein Spo0J
VTVWWDGKAWACVDGHHRLAAYVEAGRGHSDVPVRVFEGSLEEALVLAARTNTRDKLPMSRAEKSNAAWRLVLTTQVSKATLAEAAGVSERTVAHMRRVQRALQESGRHRLTALLDMTWDNARRLSLGQEAPDWDPEEEERRAQEFATKLHKVFGVQGHKQPDVFLRAVELYSPKLLETLETMLRERFEEEPEEATE